MVSFRPLLTCALVALLTTAAEAEPRRVIVGDFSGGAKARELHDAVVGILAGAKYTVIQVRSTAAEADEIASQLAAEARVTGSLEPNRKKHLVLTVRVADKAVTLNLGRRGQLQKRDAKTLKRKLVAALNSLPPSESVAEDASASRTPTPIVALTATAPANAEPMMTPAVSTGLSVGEPAPQAEVVVPSPAPVAAPTPAHHFDNFGRVRSAMPLTWLQLRSFYDSRKMAAVEQEVGLKLPLQFWLNAKVTLGTAQGSFSDLSTFALDATLFSPMVYSVGAATALGGYTGMGNDTVAVGVAQTMLHHFDPVHWYSFHFWYPYQSAGPGGHFATVQGLMYRMLRAEVLVAYFYPSLSQITKPAMIYSRSEVRATLWKGVGVYSQFEYNSALEMNGKGLRFGAELFKVF